MEGYLTKKEDGGGIFSEPWTRRYFVLQDRDLYYYKTKEDYQYEPKKSIKNRPIDLNGCAESSPNLISSSSDQVLDILCDWEPRRAASHSDGE
jgi:hypothetical protein